MTQRRVEVQIAATADAMDAGLNAAQTKLRTFEARVNSGGRGGAGGGLEIELGKGLENLGKGVIGVHAIAGALDLAAVGAKAFSGDMKSALEAAERLPFGIGRVIASFDELAGISKGLEEEEKRIEDAEKKRLERIEQVKKVEEEIARLRKEGESVGQENARTAAIGGKQGFAGQIAGVEFDHNQAVEKIKKEAQDLRDKLDKEIGRDHLGRSLSRTKLEQGTEEIDATQQDRLAKEQESFENKRAALQKQADDERADQARAAGLRMIQLQDQQQAAEAELAGNHFEARKDQIISSYRERIAAATGGERDMLTKVRDLEIAEAFAAEQQRSAEADKQAEADRRRDREKEFDQRERAGQQAQSLIEQRAGIIEGQHLAATDAGFLTKGVGTDKSQELLANQNRLAEETNRILREWKTKEQQRQQFVEFGS